MLLSLCVFFAPSLATAIAAAAAREDADCSNLRMPGSSSAAASKPHLAAPGCCRIAHHLLYTHVSAERLTPAVLPLHSVPFLGPLPGPQAHCGR